MNKPRYRIVLIHAPPGHGAHAVGVWAPLAAGPPLEPAGWQPDVRHGAAPHFLIATFEASLPAGKLRLIGVTTPRRMPRFADVPTVLESGLPGFAFNSWFALMAPAGTPKAIVQTLHSEISKALADREVRGKLIAQGLTPRGTLPDELAKDLRAQLPRYGALIKQAGITAE